MKKLLSLTAGAMVIALASIWFTSCEKEKNGATDSYAKTVEDRSVGDSKVFPPSAQPYGKSYTEWTKVWLEKFYNTNCDQNPWEHPEYALFYTSGPVYFAAGIAELHGTVNITIPHGKAFLFPTFNDWWFLCPGELEQARINRNDPDLTEEEYLTGSVLSDMSNIDENSLSITVDGAEVSNVPAYKFITGLFDFTGNPCYGCVTGNPQHVATGGYYAMLKPLSKGQHTIHYHMEAPNWNAVQDATYNITVE